MSSRSGETRIMTDGRRSSATTRTTLPRTPRPMSAAQRKKLATEQLLKAVKAPSADKDKAITAALEAVSERLTWDTELEQSVRQKYDSLRTLGTGAAGPKEDFGPMPPLIRTPGLNRQSPLHVLDPYEVALDYGRDQLRNVIRRASQPNLRVAAGLVKERNPGKKPSGQSKQALIDFIVEHVAGPGY